MATMDVSVVLKLIDDLTGPAKAASTAMDGLRKSINQAAAAGRRMNSLDAGVRKMQSAAAAASKDAQGLAASFTKAATEIRSAAGAMRATATATRGALDAANAVAAAQSRVERSTAGAARAARAQAAAFTHSNTVAGRLASMIVGSHLKNQFAAARPHAVAHGTFEATADLSAEIFKMAALGRTSKEIAEARAVALQVAKQNPLMTEAEGLKTIRELTGIYGEMHEALAQLPFASFRQSYLKKLVPQETDPAHNLARAAELLGVQTTTQAGRDRANNLMDAWAKSIAAAGGKMTTNDVFRFAQYQRSSARGLSDEVLGYVMPAIAQEMRGSSTGTSVSSFMRAMVGGHMTKQAIGSLDAYGLIRPEAIIRSSKGTIQGVRPDAMIRSDLLKSSPLQWVQDVLLPTLKAKGLTEQSQIAPVLSQIFSNRNAENLTHILAFDLARLMKEAANAKASLSPRDAAKLMIGTDLSSGYDALKASISGLAAEANITAVGPVVSGMNALSAAIHDITGAIAFFTGARLPKATDHDDKNSHGGPPDIRNGLAMLGIGGLGLGFATRFGLGALRGGIGPFGALAAGGLVGGAVGGESGALYGAATALTGAAGALTAAAARMGSSGLPGMMGASGAPSGGPPGGPGSGKPFAPGVPRWLPFMTLPGLAYDIYNMPQDKAGLEAMIGRNAQRTSEWSQSIASLWPDWLKPLPPMNGEPTVIDRLKAMGAAPPALTGGEDFTLGAIGRFRQGVPFDAQRFQTVPAYPLTKAAESSPLMGSIEAVKSLGTQLDVLLPAMTGKGRLLMDGIATGMQQGAAAVTGQVQDLMTQLASLAAAGITIPIRTDTSAAATSVQSAMQAGGAARAPAPAAKTAPVVHANNTINVHGTQDAAATAREVHRRFAESVANHLNDIG